MDEEDELFRPQDWTQRDIEKLSIRQLEEYVEELNAEIKRVEADINSKKLHANVAEAMFKTGD